MAAAFSLAYFVGAFLIPMPTLKQQMGPGFFPKGIGIAMLILSGIYVFQQFRGGVKEDEERAVIIGAEEKIQGKVNLKRIGFILVLMVFYAFVFERLGYAISTFVVFMVGVFYLDRRHLVRDGYHRSHRQLCPILCFHLCPACPASRRSAQISWPIT